MAYAPVARRVAIAVLVCVPLAACRTASGVTVEWRLEPVPPVVGVSHVARVRVLDPGRGEVVGARLRLEAHMTHPGMAPEIADLIEVAGGTYEGQIVFSMSGDWVLVVSGELGDGRRVLETFEIGRVAPAG